MREIRFVTREALSISSHGVRSNIRSEFPGP